MIRKIYAIIYACLITGFLISCGSGTESDKTTDATEEVADDASIPEVEISPEAIEDIINAIPSPLEIASLIKATGAPYNEEMLNSTDNTEKYITSAKKAFNLGIYGADLGYINIYDKTGNSLTYLETIKDVADDLKIGHFFDFSTLKRLATNSSNMDSLLYISTSGLENMNQYLRDQGRGNLSVLIITGGWLEATHIASQVYLDNGKSKELAERIGEQKITLNEIMILLSVYQKDNYFKSLYHDFSELKTLYDKVEINYIYEEPITKEVDGMLQIIDNSRSEIKITESNVQAIADQVEKIREKLTQ